MALTEIQKIRLNVGDTDPVFPILTDETYEYLLELNEDNLKRSSVQASRMILLQLASLVEERADVLEIKGHQYFQNYKSAIELFLKDPSFSSVSAAMIYCGGISKSDIQDNIADPDNNYVKVEKSIPSSGYYYDTSPFEESCGFKLYNPFGD